MARRKKSTKPPEVENYKHDRARRRMIPTAEQQGFVPDDDTLPIELRYPRDPDLDPQLVWRGKDAENGSDLVVEAPPVYIQEKIHPRQIIERLRAETNARRDEAADQIDLFADFNGRPDDLEARTEFYAHNQNWSNRMILGDALLVMGSLAEREGLRGKVQCIYMDPPYGIKFNSNWQNSTSTRDVRDGVSSHVSREPEVVRAFRDTWKEGVNSYLSYIRDRLTICRELLTDNGSIFVQIGDENVHLMRNLLDEVFGVDNFISQIVFSKTPGLTAQYIPNISDYILWYSRNQQKVKYHSIFNIKGFGQSGSEKYDRALLPNLREQVLPANIRQGKEEIPDGWRAFRFGDPTSQRQGRDTTFGSAMTFEVSVKGKIFLPPRGRGWTATAVGMDRLNLASRLDITGKTISYKRFLNDFTAFPLTNVWADITGIQSRSDPKIYVVQTATTAVDRCILMTTDPGDLVLDPTCGSGTTAYVSEQRGRRWITIDTSRVALTLARSRLMGARYPYYLLQDSELGAAKEAEISARPPAEGPYQADLRQGFVYERSPHITLKSIANNSEIEDIWKRWQAMLEPLRAELNSQLSQEWEEWEIPTALSEEWPKPAKESHEKWWTARRERQAKIDASIARNADVELLYDRPYEDRKAVRVAGPFTVESLSPHRVIPTHEDPAVLAAVAGDEDGEAAAAPISDGEQTDFARVVYEHLKAAGVQNTKKGERIEFDSLEPWAGQGWIAFEGRYERAGKTVRAAIAIGPEYDAVGYEFVRAAAREARDAFDELIVCGFQFAPEVDDTMLNFGRLTVLKARMNQDIRMGDKLKNTGAGNLFVVFGEPDIETREAGDGMIEVEIKGVDIFDPTTGEVKSSDDPADDIACWFIDDDYDEESFFVRQAYFLGGAAGDPYKALKRALKAEIDEEAWATLHTTVSRPFPRPESGRICVKVINHFGDEVQKVFDV